MENESSSKNTTKFFYRIPSNSEISYAIRQNYNARKLISAGVSAKTEQNLHKSIEVRRQAIRDAVWRDLLFKVSMLCLIVLSACKPSYVVVGENVVMDHKAVLHVANTDTLAIYSKCCPVINHELCAHDKKGGTNE